MLKVGRRSKVILRLFALSLLFILFTVQAAFATDITSYTYYRNGSSSIDYYPVPAPSPYKYVRSIYAKDLRVESLSNISNLFVSDEYVYISSGGSIIITDHEFNTIHVINSFNGVEGNETLSDISGIWVTVDGEIYACEPGKGRILHFNADWTIERVLNRPEGLIINENVTYQPMKVAVDSVGRIYTVANNVYEGIIEMNVDGTFSRYFGVVNVKFTAAQLFWRSLQTDVQRAKSAEWLPVNFSNLNIDKDDFVYATVAGSGEKEPIRKLNAKGTNILRYPISTGIKPHGDLMVNRYGRYIPTGESTITAVDVNEYGMYVLLDSKRSRIFAYDEDGYMLYALGEAGTAKGRFQTPIDIRFMGDDKLLVVDRGNRSIEVFELNDYGKSIHNAVKYQSQSDYHAAADEWKNVIDYNPSYQYAYLGIGKALYRDGDYEGAQHNFMLGQDVEYYSEAFKKTRQNSLNERFALYVMILVAIFLMPTIRKLIKRIKLKKQRAGGVKDGCNYTKS